MARYLVFYWRLYRLHQRGVRLVWTVHDLDNHDTRHIRVETFAARRLCRILDAIILHGPLAKEILESRWGPNACRRIRAIPHFNYIESYKNDADRAGAQSALELNESTLTFLFLGLIRPYKGVREMVDAFSVCAKSNTRLIIAGRPVSDAIRREIGDVVAKDKRIRFIPGRVPDDDIQMYMNAGLGLRPVWSTIHEAFATWLFSLTAGFRTFPELPFWQCRSANRVSRPGPGASPTFSTRMAQCSSIRPSPETSSGPSMKRSVPPRV